jgi:hypothetical protein
MLGRFALLHRHSVPQMPFKITVYFMAVWYYVRRVLQKKNMYDFIATLRNFQSPYFYDKNAVSPGPFLKRAQMRLFCEHVTIEKHGTFVE